MSITKNPNDTCPIHYTQWRQGLLLSPGAIVLLSMVQPFHKTCLGVVHEIVRVVFLQSASAVGVVVQLVVALDDCSGYPDVPYVAYIL